MQTHKGLKKTKEICKAVKRWVVSAVIIVVSLPIWTAQDLGSLTKTTVLSPPSQSAELHEPTNYTRSKRYAQLLIYYKGNEEALRTDLDQWQVAYQVNFQINISPRDLVLKEEFFELVNEVNHKTGEIKPRKLVHIDGDWHRDVRILLLTSDQRRVLIQKRDKTKDVEPGKFAESAGGHLQLGENYLAAALRELAEELDFEQDRMQVARERLFEIGVYNDDVNRSKFTRYVYLLSEEEEANINKADGIVAKGTRFWELTLVKELTLENENLFTSSLVEAFTDKHLYTRLLKEPVAEYKKTKKRKEDLLRGILTDSEITKLTARQMADILRLLDISLYSMQEKFLLYSAAPGSGKGAIMDLTFKDEGAPYGDLVQQLLLYHTREPRRDKGEEDGKDYHFGQEDVGNNEKNRLLRLGSDGKIYLAYVNKQLQGLAKDDFLEENVILHDDDTAEIVRREDRNKTKSKDENGNPITIVTRPIKGLSSAFGDPKITVLEGGYGWFRSILLSGNDSNQNQNIFTIFISPFTDEQLAFRATNKRVINGMFNDPVDRYKAYLYMNQKRKDLAKEELNLTQDEQLKQELEWKIGQLTLENFDIQKKEGIGNAEYNARKIESKQFIEEIHHLAANYFELPEDWHEKFENAEYIMRALAYEVHRKLIADRGEKAHRLEIAPREKESTANFTDAEDTFNRVIEGVVQIMTRGQYKRNSKGDIVINSFVWSGVQEDIGTRVKEVSENFGRSYFAYLLKAIRAKNLMQLRKWQDGFKKYGRDVTFEELLKMELFRVTDEYGNYTGELIPRELAHLNGTWHRGVFMFLVNKRGEILIQTRSANKRAFPGARDTSASGHLGVVREYIDGAIMETEEEVFNGKLKLDPSRVKLVGEESSLTLHHQDAVGLNDSERCSIFVYFINDEEIAQIEVQPEEVEKVEWVGLEDELGRWNQWRNDPVQAKRSGIDYAALGINILPNEKLVAEIQRIIREKARPERILVEAVEVSL